jgi:hypothetical protein
MSDGTPERWAANAVKQTGRALVIAERLVAERDQLVETISDERALVAALITTLDHEPGRRRLSIGLRLQL